MHNELSGVSAGAVILDTNVLVAAGFNPRSRSARIVRQVRTGQLRMIWNDSTRREIEYVLEKIPRLAWSDVAELFRDADRYPGPIDPDRFDFIPDPDDRKFAALSEATGAVLISSDRHLLIHRQQAPIEVLTPGQYCRRRE